MPTAYSYLRFSSPKQEWGDSERRQEQGARDYCLQHGLTLSEKTFADRGISGWKGANRKGALGDLLKILKAGDYLLIEDNDRLSREDPLTAMNLLHSIVFNGATIVITRDGSIITKENFFSLSIFIPNIIKGALANQENEKKSGRLRDAWTTRRKKMATGSYVGGTLPFWIKKQSDGTLALIEERAKVVERIFDLSYNGMGTRAILRQMNDEGVPTFRSHKTWTNYAILYLLDNPAVYGAIQPHVMDSNKQRHKTGEEIANYYRPVITKERFLAVRNKIQQRNINKGGGNKGGGVANLFSVVMKCAKCGKTILLTHKGGGAKKYLVCSEHHYFHKCTSAIINYPFVERAILDYIKRDSKAIQFFSADNQTAVLQQELDAKQGQIQSIKKTLNTLSETALKEGLPTILNNKMKELEAQQIALEAECDAIKGKQFEATHTLSFDEITAYIDSQLKQGKRARFVINTEGEYEYDTKMPEDRYLIRDALRTFIKSIILDIEAKRISVEWQSGAQSHIEMRVKRNGIKKAEYFYRTWVQENTVSEWHSLGNIPNWGSKQAQQPIPSNNLSQAAAASQPASPVAPKESPS